MKDNFFISVSNGLLEDSHRERMGSTIWQFLWCLDKVTKIDDDGVGVVLGGKPVQLKEIIGGHRITISKNLSHLEKEGYISLKHTPYGIIIKVMKMKKRFSNNAKPNDERISENAKPTLSKTLNPCSENAKPVCENAKPNKTNTVDNTVDNNSMTEEVVITPSPKQKAEKFFIGIFDLMRGERVDWLKDLLLLMAEKTPSVSKQTYWDEIKKFYFYWTEKNPTGKKQRWELEKTFEIELRVYNWLRRSGISSQPLNNFNKNNKGKTIIGL